MVAIGDVPPVLGRTGRGIPLALGLQGEAETEATSAAANSNVLENMVTLGVWMDVWGVMLFMLMVISIALLLLFLVGVAVKE